jgi:hypothetical protein
MRKSKADDLSGWISDISEDPTQRMTRLEADLNEAHGRISDRMEDLQRERIENDGLRGALKAANQDYRALQTRFLPELSNYLTVPFDEAIPEDGADWEPDAGEPMPQPVKDTWQPPPPVDWQEWERNYDEQHEQAQP